MVEQAYDVAVIGGGMIGAAAALGLAQAGFSVVVIESQTFQSVEIAATPTLRISALSMGSVRLLEHLGVWQNLCPQRCVPYRTLETWEWENAKLQFCAQELHLPQLGFMVENEVLQQTLWQHLTQMPNVSLKTPAQLVEMKKYSQGWRLQLNEGLLLQARLVIGADGADSRVRALAGIGVCGWQYGHACMLITVATQQSQQDITWQQFTPNGQRAFLPLWEEWASLAWYDTPARLRQLMTLSMPQLTKEIMHVFPSRLAKVDASAAGVFSLVRRHAHQYVQEGLALLGDAAHTIHPLAGQGVNLGYRDLDRLLSVVIQARRQGECWFSAEILQRYQQQRRWDNMLMQGAMDLFHGTFNNSLKPLQLFRNAGLMVAARSGRIKKQVLKYALGV